MKLFKTKKTEIIEAQRAFIKGQEELISMLNSKVMFSKLRTRYQVPFSKRQRN